MPASANEVPSAAEDDLLGKLLDAAQVTPPHALADLLARHCAAAGLRDLVLQLQDYDQQQLMVMPVAGRGDREPDALDASMAGRAFTTEELVESARTDGVRLWAPMLDGTGRVGALSVTVNSADEPTRQTVRRLASLAADLIVTKGAYTDVFIGIRRRRQMSLQAEMQWNLLPPLVMTTPTVSLAGALQPPYEVGGDAFDYALNHDTLHVAILDAVGHGLRAALMATTATAAYRHARRARVSLEEIYTVMDRTVAEQFALDEFATAQVAELETRTGVLRWINAGHPAPLLIRGHHVLGPLISHTTLPVGFGGVTPSVAREQLQAGDRVLLFTDGAIEQRTRDGTRLGDATFEALVERACSAGLIVAETVRRLVESLLDQIADRTFDDDATIVLLEWHGPHCAAAAATCAGQQAGAGPDEDADVRRTAPSPSTVQPRAGGAPSRATPVGP